MHIADAEKEAEFQRKVEMLSVQFGRPMHASRADMQGVTNQLLHAICDVTRARSVRRGTVTVRIEDELKSVSRSSLWQLHQTMMQCEHHGEYIDNQTD